MVHHVSKCNVRHGWCFQEPTPSKDKNVKALFNYIQDLRNDKANRLQASLSACGPECSAGSDGEEEDPTALSDSEYSSDDVVDIPEPSKGRDNVKGHDHSKGVDKPKSKKTSRDSIASSLGGESTSSGSGRSERQKRFDLLRVEIQEMQE